MNKEEYIKTGILEMYVLGHTSEEQNIEIEKLSNLYPEIKKEIEDITESLMLYAEANVESVNPTIKPMVIATIDYTERLKSGEVPAFPYILNEKSVIADYAEWLNRGDMVMPDDFNDIYAKIIGASPEAMTAIVWIKDATPYEVHTDEYEKFLIVEGTCDIQMDSKTVSLVPGDYLSIPLHEGHIVKVTSKIPCKVILQRVAA